MQLLHEQYLHRLITPPPNYHPILFQLFTSTGYGAPFVLYLIKISP